MRATTIHAPRDIRVEQVPDPRIEEQTDAIVRVTAGCICGSDLWRYRGQNPITPGSTIGHEVVGVVEDVGADVRRIRVGDFVIVPFCHCDNTCPNCVAGVQSACVNRGTTQSGQAELTRVGQADGSLVRTDPPGPHLMPSILSLTDVLPTGWHAAVSGGVRPGMTVAVVGDGAVGLCAVLAAQQQGAERIIAMSRHEDRQRLAREFGATDVVAERDEAGIEAVKELTKGIGVEATLECVGTDQSIRTAFGLARAGSTVGFVGVPHGVTLPIEQMFGLNIGLRGGVAPVRRYLPDLLSRVLAGSIEPGRIFDLDVALDDVAEGYRAMDERRAIKVIVRP
ncbi:MAG: zinc-dependent alcohol dehydrogenase family protein [Intrasporangium sp.]|uniref:zinc-dependent alcohol dehydrogenase family protein n=1 Tax=Intrasporangium sp. TaxID=1925024 RepID=UPI002648180D|nr:zinc-dependent alcohol dehydrogenase family protein [Intrasporangium sp.]MDN5797413.1 zinc-dependent alcohol dehydrogenase family protein [Intrasporangium sp.]